MKEKVIIIAGPTASGKSSLAINLAKKVNGEIISCDSMQIYKGMDIGTAKVGPEERREIDHHMIDIISPGDTYSVQDFQKSAKSLIKDIHKRGKLPILAGGTGLYINSILYDYDFSNVEPKPLFRAQMEEKYSQDPQSLLDKLINIDSKLYSRLTIKDKKKIIRALEVYEFSKKTISVDSKENDDYDYYLFVINDDRQDLYNRINQRVDIMLHQGLLKEVKNLLDQGLTKDHQSMKAIGYREVIPYLQGEIDFDSMVESLKQDTRRYAKRQLTWFRKNKQAIWLDRSKLDSEQMIKVILGEINEL
ncbi:MAG: tRNA (adenosine(37)-N6)-dimethylallyltransferase MiaA [Tissierellia bacterium]|nr:tRNA (adenosine(37)-N6)-dimethylallyltransferase MiaA [Tissierellia bacterium]